MAQCLAARVTADDETLEDLGVGRETVRRHVAPIYGKLGSPSRLELARLIHPKGAS